MILDKHLTFTKNSGEYNDGNTGAYSSTNFGKTPFLDKEYWLVVKALKSTMSASDAISVIAASNAALTSDAVTVWTKTLSSAPSAGDTLVTMRLPFKLQCSDATKDTYFGIKCTTCTTDEVAAYLVEKSRVNEIVDITLQ